MVCNVHNKTTRVFEVGPAAERTVQIELEFAM